MSVQYGGDKITFADGSTVASGWSGFKNRIINGAMMIDQRNAGASVTITDTSTTTYTLDRWFAYGSVASKFSVQRNAGSVTPPVGFINYAGVTSLSSYSVGASENFQLTQRIEGFNTADLAWGTANAKTVTLSFWVYSSLTGTFGGAFRNNAQNRSYPFSYSIPVANTWTQISITVAGDITGTWSVDNSVGIVISFGLGCGSTFSGTAGSWASGNLISATGATSVVGTSGATFYITGVQLEKGSTATSFDYRPYGTELALCQRYCEVFTASGNTSGTRFQIYGVATNDVGISIPFKVTKRATAAVSGTYGFYANNASNGIYYCNDANGVLLYATASGNGLVVIYQSSGTAIFSAEL